MASVNKVIMIGNVGKDVEVRYSPSGMAVCSVSIATSYKRKGAEEKTEWHRVVFFDRLAEIAGEYLKKGRPVYVEGRLETKKYTDKSGVEKYATEIIAESMQLLGGRDEAEKPAARPAERPNRAPQPKSNTGFDNMDDDIPF